MKPKPTVIRPPYRKLRGYAFDPITSLDLDTADINQIVYKVPWENNLEPGPSGEYVRVIDRDPASDAVYAPVDLNDPAILAMDGLAPSETNPQFHQQMVYAVIMYTIRNFEKALGRKVLWSPVEMIDARNKYSQEFVPQLLVYPHAFRDENAYYSPDRKALLFGYYNARPADGGTTLPGGIVYSCLSHDIIAHETTHALLDGMYSRYMEITHPDVAGFHEGFSDIVALLQHFTYPEIVRNQIRKSGGRLDAENLLAKLAVEFGQTTGLQHSLRDAIGRTNENGEWERTKTSTLDYEGNLECHERGALLVSAVFDAFIAIYKNRTADLVRLATGGTGNLPSGDIHPDLVNRLADEAAKVASHVLNMCVRALDYCPPVDLNYGDYLRALITADRELVSDDDHHYRIAFINAFRKRGIFPEGVPNLSVDTLSYNPLEEMHSKTVFSEKFLSFLRRFKDDLAYKTDRQAIFESTRQFIIGDIDKDQKGFHTLLFEETNKQNQKRFEELTGLVITDRFRDFGINPSRTHGRDKPAIEIHSLRLMNKTGPGGTIQNQIAMSLVQTARVAVEEDYLGNRIFVPYRRGTKAHQHAINFSFRSGCTLIFDLDNLSLRHVIKKPLFQSNRRNLKPGQVPYNLARLEMQYRCQYGDLYHKIEGLALRRNRWEPLASIHQVQKPII